MALKIGGTTVVNDSRALENITNLKTVGGTTILGTGDIPFPASAPSSHVGATGAAHGVATTSVAGFMSSTDKTKLDGVQSGATAYTHPTNHPASIITQDVNNRFVTDAEKASWNAKVGSEDVQTLSNKTLSNTVFQGSYTETIFQTSGTGVTTLSPTDGTLQVLDVIGPCTLSYGTWSAGQSITLMISNPSGSALSWPATTWVNNAGLAPTLSTTGFTVVGLWMFSGSVYGAFIGNGQ